MIRDDLFSAQTKLGEVGTSGQARIAEARVLCLGYGGLGHPCVQYLAAMGVGQISVMDSDHVDVSNLHRQVYFSEEDVGKGKLEAARRLEKHFPNVKFNLLEESFLPTWECVKMAGDHDLVIDCSDSYSCRYSSNFAGLYNEIPVVQAAVFQWSGTLTVFNEKGGGCLGCLFPEYPEASESCQRSGVIGVLPGILGSMQAMVGVRLLLGLETGLRNKLLTYDARCQQFRKLGYNRDPGCPVCSSELSLDRGLMRDIREDGLLNSYGVNLEQCREQRWTMLEVRSEEEIPSIEYLGLPTVRLGLEFEADDKELSRRLGGFKLSKGVCLVCSSGRRARRWLGRIRKLRPDVPSYFLLGGTESLSAK